MKLARGLAAAEPVGGRRPTYLDAVTESGTRKYMAWATRFPFIFAIEVERLR